MKRFFRHKSIGIALLFSILLIIGVKASDIFTVSVTTFNDSEFPRVQVAMQISGDKTDLMAKDIDIEEGGIINIGPKVLLPPHNKPSQIDLHIMVDTSGNTSDQEGLIKSNLKSLVQYIYDLEMNAGITIESFDGSQRKTSNSLQAVFNDINILSFSGSEVTKIDGFAKIESVPSETSRQKVLLIVNGTAFENGLNNQRVRDAIKAVRLRGYPAFVLGHPLKAMHAVKADNIMAELVDLSHSIPGGYLGGFGADLTSMVDLLNMQSSKDYVLQYYRAKSGSQAILKIIDINVDNFTYSNAPSSNINIEHIPDNELVAGEDMFIEVDLEYPGNMVNAVELKYTYQDDNIFESIPLIHKRSQSTEDALKYTVNIPVREPEDASAQNHFSYYFLVNTPYASKTIGGADIPINVYDNEINLNYTLFPTSQEVSWYWDGATVNQGKSFEVWDGDTLIGITEDKHYEIPLDECNRYQNVHVVVILSNGERKISAPVEYYADEDDDEPITEEDGVRLMLQCINNKEIDNYTVIHAMQDFDSTKNLKLDRAGIYLARIIAEDIWKKNETIGYFEMLYYIMIYIDREEYIAYGIEKEDIKQSLVYKLISCVNNTADVNKTYDDAREELAKRLLPDF